MLITLATTTTLLMLIAPATIAQENENNTREGFWIGFGLGGGSSKAGDQDPIEGGGAYLRMGGTINKKFLLGGEAIGWGRSENGVGLTRSNIALTGIFYPSETGGFYLKGGLGTAIVEFQIGGLKFSENGGGATFGLGYEIGIGNNLVLVPAFDFFAQSFDQGGGNKQTSTAALLTVGLTWH